MSKTIYFSFLILVPILLFGQEESEVVLSSPYQSIRTHLYYLQADQENPALAAAPFVKHTKNLKAAQSAAIKLKQVLDGSGIYMDMSVIPTNVNYYDSTLMSRQYRLSPIYPEILLVKEGDEWVYPLSSIAAITDAHSELFIWGTDRLLDLLPSSGTRMIFGLYVYQYIGIFVLVLISTIVHFLFSLFFNRLFVRMIKRAGYTTLAEGFLLPIARPASMFVVLSIALVFVPILQLPPSLTKYALLGLKALIPLFGTVVFYRLINIIALYLHRMAEKTQSSLDDQLVPLIRKTLKTFVVIIGTLFILDNLRINILPVLTGLSIGGLAFALAAQDTLKNFFGSVMIFIDKPFQIGDWITSGDIDGSVEEVGFRSSRIRTFRNSVMYVPNSKLADSMIDNHGLRKYRRYNAPIAVTYDTPPELIELFVEGLRKVVENHPKTLKDNYHIYFNSMGDFSLNIMFYIFFEVPTWGDELKARHEILIEVVKLANSLNVQFAFPTQTLHMESFPGQPSLSPAFPDDHTARAQMAAHFKPK